MCLKNPKLLNEEVRGGRSNMANNEEQAPEGAPEEQGQQIDLEALTTEQAFGIITNAVRSQPFTYIEHVQLEQAREAVGRALQPG